jgi:MFS superfamily sulfate permease-like transporter
VGWLAHYQPKWLAADVATALSVWALLVPHELAYARVAGVPVQYGLYTAFAALVAVHPIPAACTESHGLGRCG